MSFSQPRMRSAFAFDGVEQHVNTVADLDVGGVVELVLVEDAFGLEPDVNEEVVAGLADDLAGQDRAAGEVGDVVLQQFFHVAARDGGSEGRFEHRLGLDIFNG